MTKRQVELQILLQDLILAFVINTTATILAGGFQEATSYLVGMFQAFCINYIAGLIIPVDAIGNIVANKIIIKRAPIAHKAVRLFVVNAIFVTIVSFTIALIHVGVTPQVVQVWITTYPVLHLVGYFTSLAIEAPCVRLSQDLLDSNK